MTDELNNTCTDLKELFMQQDFEKMEEILGGLSGEAVREMAMNQQGIIAKYYAQEKLDMIFSHLNFVAFASFLYEYAGKTGAFSKEEYADGFRVFTDIYAMLQQLKQEQ